jgi:GT2 family glycosyltransferase/nucleoside-diphosphate-sugar epimerase
MMTESSEHSVEAASFTGNRTGVVVVSYHTGPMLWLCLSALLLEPEVTDMVVVDNGNPQWVVDSLNYLVKQNPKIRLITGHGNIGFAKACNLGAAALDTDYIALVNPDCVVTRGVFAQMIHSLASYPDAVLAGARLLEMNGEEQQGGRRAQLTPENLLGEGSLLSRFVDDAHLKFNYHKDPVPEQVIEIPAISGAFMLMRLPDYRAMNGMDEDYFLHVEDLDFCKRASERGKILFVPQAIVWHAKSTSDACSFQVEKWKSQSFLLYFRKHYATAPKGQMLLVKLAIYGRLAIKGLLSCLPRRRKQEEFTVKAINALKTGLDHATKKDALKGRTIVVSGATSQIGLDVIGRLLAEEAYVFAINHRRFLPFIHPRLWNLSLKHQPLAPVTAECLIHTAPLWHLPALLEGGKIQGLKHVIAIGSTSVFTKKDSQSEAERDVVVMLSNAEERIIPFCQKHGIALTLLRPTMVYGFGMDENITRMASLVRKLRCFPVEPPAQGLRSPVHADDLAKLCAHLAEHPQEGFHAYNVEGADELSFRDMVARLFPLQGLPTMILPIPKLGEIMDVLGDMGMLGKINGDMARRMNQNLVFDHSEAMAELRHQPRSYLSGGHADIGLFTDEEQQACLRLLYTNLQVNVRPS